MHHTTNDASSRSWGDAPYHNQAISTTEAPNFLWNPRSYGRKVLALGNQEGVRSLSCTEEQKVTFATFTFEGAALVWWQLKKPLEPVWLWPRFLELFNDEYFLEMVRDQKTVKFLNLKQGKMTVVEYNTIFIELCRYAPHILSIESRKVRKFEAGLR